MAVSRLTKARPRAVYVIGSEHGPYKIGMAVSPDIRLREIQTGSHAKLSIAYLHSVPFSCASKVESKVHVRFVVDAAIVQRVTDKEFFAEQDKINHAKNASKRALVQRLAEGKRRKKQERADAASLHSFLYPNPPRT